jgi:hypothetical protein
MDTNTAIIIGYAAFLFILLAINLLYFFQVFKYRLPGDASISVLTIHLILVLSVVTFGTLLAF